MSRFTVKTRSAIAVSFLIGLLCAAAIPSSAQTTYIETDRTIAGGNPLTGTFGTVVVGVSSNGATVVPNVHADFVAGTNITSNLQGLGTGSVMTLYGGTVKTVTAGTTFIMQGGTVESVTSGSQVDINGGTITQGVDSRYGNFNINGGDITSVFFGDTTSFRLHANVTGGTIHGVAGSNFGFALYSQADATTISGGTIDGGVFYTASLLQVQGGTISGELQIGQGGSTSAAISGGAFGGGIYNIGTGVTTFYGDGITLTGATPGTFTTRLGNNVSGTYYNLNGTFQNGQSAANTVFFASNRTDGATGYVVVPTAPSGAAAPEPASLALLLPAALSAVIVRRRATTAAK